MENNQEKKKSLRPKKSYAELITRSELLVKAMSANQEILPALQNEFVVHVDKIFQHRAKQISLSFFR